jgi:hypothetical protein
VLNSGLEFGGNFAQPNGEIHGLKINLANSAAGCSGVAIDAWGTGTGVHVWDSWLDGNNRTAAGGINSTNGGLDVRRSVITGFYSSGIRSWCNCHDPPHSSTHTDAQISDLVVKNIHMTPAGSDSGRTEQGMLLAFPVANGVSRVLIQDAFIGFEPVLNFDDTMVTDLEISGTAPGIYSANGVNNVAIYPEANTYGWTLDRFLLAGTYPRGINCEYDHGVVGNGACHQVHIQHGTITTDRAGIYFDQGQEANVVDDVTLNGQSEVGAVDVRPQAPSTFTNIHCNVDPGVVCHP